MGILDVIPGAVGSLPVVGNGGNSFQPLQSRAQANQTALMNKVAELRGFYNQLHPTVRNALVQFDANRVATGSAPLTRDQTVAAANAAQNRRLPKEGTERDWWNIPGNLVGDLKSVVGAVPRLFDPRTWINEVTALPSIPQHIADATAHGDDVLHAVATAPGIRMVPGSFVAGNLLHPAELARHPLFTALDTLPAAEAFAKTRPVVRAAESAAREAGSALEAGVGVGGKALTPVEHAILSEQSLGRSPLRTFATRKLDEAGNIVPNRLGAVGKHIAEETGLGRVVSEALGKPIRDVSGRIAQGEQRIIAVRDGLVEPSTPFEQLTRDSQQLAERYGQTQEQRAELVAKMHAGDRSAYTPEELAIANEYRQITNRYAEASAGEVQQVDGEWLPRQQAERVKLARGKAQSSARISVLRDEYLAASGTAQPADFLASVDNALTSPTRLLQKHELEAVSRALDAYGFDVTASRKALLKANRAKGGMEAAADQLRADIARGPGSAAPRLSADDLLTRLDAHRDHVQATVLKSALADQNPTRISAALDNLLQQRNSRLHWIDDEGVVDSIRSLSDRYKWEAKYGKLYTARRASRAATKAEQLAARTVPARFGPLVTEATRGKVVDQVLPHGASAETAEAITRAVTEARWTDVDDLLGSATGTTRQLYSGIEREVASTWQQMRDAGLDPEFVHRVNRGQAGKVASPRIGPVPNSISQVRERALDFSPSVDDWAVSLTHQGMEHLTRTASEQIIDYVVQRYGVKQADLQRTFAPWARDAETPANFQQQLRDQIGDRFVAFNPDKAGYSWGGTKLDKFRQESWFIPKTLANNLHRIAEPKGLLGGAFDPITKTFRTAVVGLSPRTQLYNILGGATMMFGETGPGAFKYWSRARKLVKNPSMIEDETLRAMIGSQKREFLDSDLKRAQAQTGVLMGKTARRIYDQAHELGFISKMRAGTNKLVEKSFDLNGLFDDQYRVMSYLYGYDKAMNKGLTAASAARAGEELLRKTMMDWTTLTPIERNVFKTVFPFYGFMRHSIQYVTRYPLDHPLRAAVLGAFGKAETDDLGGLPLSFLSMVPMPFSSEGDNGAQNMLSLGALNPFGQAADMFTLAGFVAATNPVISTALEQIGVSSRGEAELYPTLTFDPDTGQLGAVHPNILQSFAGNVIPQTQLLTSILGINQDFNSQLRRDPAAAMRSLLSNGGLPVLWQNKNLPQAYFKAEVNRLKSVNTAKNAALTSGDWSAASDMPTLQTLLDQLKQATPQQLAPYQPRTDDALREQINALLGTPGSSAGIYGR